MAIKLILLAVLVVSGYAQSQNCCSGVCCQNNGALSCTTTANQCFSGSKYTAGGKCGAGNNGFWCSKDPQPKPPQPAPPQCCQAQFPGYKDLCMNVTDKTTCVGLASGFGKTCEWTCGECDAIKGDGQYQKFCLGHRNIKSCSVVNRTCHWVPSN